MPIVAGDIEYRLSGGAANADPNASLGGAISSVEIVDATLENLFDNVDGAESTAGDIEYRGFYVINTHATLTWQNVIIWIDTASPSLDTNVEIAVAQEGINNPMQTIADESTAPVGESFSAPMAPGVAISIGNIPPGEFQGIWVRRIVQPGAAAFDLDGVVLRTRGETAA